MAVVFEGTFFNSVPANDARWFQSMGSLEGVNILELWARLHNSDGTYTFLHGSGLTWDGISTITGGTITGISHKAGPSPFDADYETVGLSFGSTALNIDAVTFFNATAKQRYDMVFGGAEILHGTAGDDLLYGAAGADTLNGNGGTDTANYSFASASVTADLLGFQVATGDAAGDIYSSIENLYGANVDGAGDSLFGSDGANWLRGFWGNDYLDGRGGNDLLDGDEGDDVLGGGAGDDTIFGGADNDIITFQDATAGITFTLAEGGAGVADVNSGGLGTDTYFEIEGVSGSEFADEINGNSADNVINGRDGSDTLRSGGGQDTIRGGAGDDFLMGGAGNDTIYGGDESGDSGNDVISFRDATAGINFTLHASGSGTANLSSGGLGTDTYFNIEHIDASEFGDTIAGNGGGNLIFGHGGHDDLRAGGGADEIYGDNGNDVLAPGNDTILLALVNWTDTVHGGAGTDTLSFFDFDSGQTMTLGAGGNGSHSRPIFGFLTHTVNYDSIENLGGTAFGDTLTGNDGNNTLYGEGGADRLDGGLGNDVLNGGAGGDTYLIGNLGDTIIEASGDTGIDLVRASVAGYTLAANVENLILEGSVFIGYGNSGGNVITGNNAVNAIGANAGNDTLFGLGGSDTLYGHAGNDWLDGGSGADGMYGGLDNDTYILSDVGDVAVESAGQGNDRVRTSLASTTMSANIEYLTMLTGAVNATGNASNNQIAGNSDANTISGGDGSDQLFGGDKDDYLNGGAGTDAMTGGLGNDTFRFVRATSQIDVITDFIAGAASGDIVDLKGSGIANFAALQPFMSQGALQTYVTINFGAGAILYLQNTNLASLNAGDFVF